MLAAINDHRSCVKRLIAAGADVNAVTQIKHVSALMYAAFHGRQRSLVALIEAGADVNHCDTDGKTSLHYSAGQPR